jgi:iron-sulfur cluster repair protein YtfE (RIC family)
MNSAEGTPRAIDILICEHNACREQVELAVTSFARVASTEGSSALQALQVAEDLLHYLETQLETHIAKEEGPLFPRLKAALPADDRLVDEMVAEHDLIRMKRQDVHDVLRAILAGHEEVRAVQDTLRQALANSTEAGRRLTRLRSAIETVADKLRVHFDNEEELVFPLASELLGGELLATIAEEMDALSSTS